MQPSQELLNQVKAGFVRQGTTLAAYCRDNNIDGGNVYRLLRGDWNGKKAKAIRSQLITASRIDDLSTPNNAKNKAKVAT